MQLHNDQEATPLHEYSERTEYMGSQHYYEPSSRQTFQQQTYSPLPASYGPNSYSEKLFTGVTPLSDSRFSALLSYVFGWVTGLLFLLFGGHNRFVRFHALQSLVFFGMITLVDFGLFLIILGVWVYRPFSLIAAVFSPLLTIGSMLVFLALNFIGVVSWIVVMIQAARGAYFRLPFVGDWVARRFNLNSMPRC